MDNIISKIQKLIAKAESAKEIGNADEAAAFTAKINELLTKHNLDSADIQVDEQPEVDGIRINDLDITKKQGGWTVSLLTTLCEFNFCKAIYHQGWNGRKKALKGVTIIGEPQNVEIVKYLYEVLNRQLKTASKKEWNRYLAGIRAALREDMIPHMKKQPWKYGLSITRAQYLKSFFLGAVNGINQKLTEAQNEAKIEHGTKITDLVLVKDAAIQEYMDENFQNLGTMSSRTKKIHGGAYNKGKETGRNTSMARGVAAGQSVATKMIG